MAGKAWYESPNFPNDTAVVAAILRREIEMKIPCYVAEVDVVDGIFTATVREDRREIRHD